MNLNDLINTICGFIFTAALAVGGGYGAYKFVQSEVIKQSQKGLPSLEKFSRQLTK